MEQHGERSKGEWLPAVAPPAQRRQAAATVCSSRSPEGFAREVSPLTSVSARNNEEVYPAAPVTRGRPPQPCSLFRSRKQEAPQHVSAAGLPDRNSGGEIGFEPHFLLRIDLQIPAIVGLTPHFARIEPRWSAVISTVFRHGIFPEEPRVGRVLATCAAYQFQAERQLVKLLALTWDTCHHRLDFCA